MHQSIMTKIKNYADKDWIVLYVIIKHSIQIFECYYNKKKWEKQVIFIQTESLLFREYKQ